MPALQPQQARRPQKFPSLRYSRHPPVLKPFKDETLVAFRYESTVPAAPPIPIPPPRNPLRGANGRPMSTLSNPVVVNPPPIPPEEQHPAFRTTPILPHRASADNWKRDSGGLAPTSSSTTIREDFSDSDPLWRKLDEKLHELEACPEVATVTISSPISSPVSSPVSPRSPPVAFEFQRERFLPPLSPPPSATVPATSHRPLETRIVDTKSLYEDKANSIRFSVVTTRPCTPPESASVPPSPGRRIPKSFSLRGGASSAAKRLRKKSMDVDRSSLASRKKSMDVERPSTATVTGSVSNIGMGHIGGGVASVGVTLTSVRFAHNHVDRDSAKKKQPGVPHRPMAQNAQTAEATPEKSGKSGSWLSAVARSGRDVPNMPPIITTPLNSSMSNSVSNSMSIRGTANNANTANPATTSPSEVKCQHCASPIIMTPGPGAPAPASVPASASASASDSENFSPITTTIPTNTLVDEDFLAQLSFSKRGSVMLGGKKVMTSSDGKIESAVDSDNTMATNTPAPAAQASSVPGHSPSSSSLSKPLPNICVMSVDDERNANKVRALYQFGEHVEPLSGNGETFSLDERLEASLSETLGDDEGASENRPSTSCSSITQHRPSEHPTSSSATPVSEISSPYLPDTLPRSEHERAGGIEDWENLQSADVDRYGFIKSRRPGTSRTRTESPSPYPTDNLSPTRPSRRRNLLSRRGRDPNKMPNRKLSTRSLHTQASDFSTSSRHSTRSSIRTVTNILPHNRDRRTVDEAGEMLELAPGAGTEDAEEDGVPRKVADALKKKELERAEKWGKMAIVIKKGKEGHGMDFEFDPSNPKVVERTWKGIPDRWRAAAWYSFLSSSAKAKPESPSEEHLIAEYGRLQEVASPDDVQIDLDVPRTVNDHVMFRKRYRGGQRLLFRVLHAISIYFPVTGYVQGMASLAATLLCYFDEEHCFVMLVRMWKHRGIDQMYQPGFEGLMAALKDFENTWLTDKDIAQKLDEFHIDPTAYATRWYLTLFNLSVPFPAQLRIWDVFMLLGDSLPGTDSSSNDNKQKETQEPPSSSSSSNKKKKAEVKAPQSCCSSGIDVIHAASAALIHALRDVLLDSDFENAMKTLTSFVPVKDADILMKVTQATYKQHCHHHHASKKMI